MTDEKKIEAMPHSFADEETLLSALLTFADTGSPSTARIEPYHFFNGAHVDIADAIKGCRREGAPVSMDGLTALLQSEGKAERFAAVGGLPFLEQLSKRRPSTPEIQAAFKTVYNHYRVRRLMSAAWQLEAEVSGGRELDGVIVRALEDIGSIGFEADSPAAIRDGLATSISDLERRITDRHVDTVPTGLARLDGLIGGFKLGDLAVIGSRPGVGKTGLLATAIHHAATALKVPVLVFSLEGSSDTFAERLIALASHVPNTSLRNATLDAKQWGRLATSATGLADSPLMVDDRAVDIDEIVRVARRWHANPVLFPNRHARGLIAIDYLQLIESKQPEENRYRELCEISRRLKQLAKRMNVAVVACSQLNRNLEGRTDKRPILSDLRESGSLEDDADLVIFVHRDAVYDPAAIPNDAEIIIAKHRNGPKGTVRAAFIPECVKFMNIVEPGSITKTGGTI